MNKRKNKIKLIVLLSTFAVLLSSCSGVDVRPELLEFTSNWSIDTCKEKYKEADFSYEKDLYRNGDLKGHKEVNYYFTMKIPSFFESTLEMVNSGEFITDDYPEYKKVHTYNNVDNVDNDPQKAYIRETIINDSNPVIEYLSEETFIVDLNTFYGQSQNGKYTRGMYYGDDVQSAFKFQEFMSISEDGNKFIYETPLVLDNPEDGNVTKLYYELNKDGMLTFREELGFTLPADNPPKSFNSTMSITYIS